MIKGTVKSAPSVEEVDWSKIDWADLQTNFQVALDAGIKCKVCLEVKWPGPLTRQVIKLAGGDYTCTFCQEKERAKSKV